MLNVAKEVCLGATRSGDDDVKTTGDGGDGVVDANMLLEQHEQRKSDLHGFVGCNLLYV